MHYRLLAAVAAIALLPAAASHAADTAAADHADFDGAADIIVTARIEDRGLAGLQTPSFGVGITAAQLGAINATNVEDLVRTAPATIVRKRYAGDPNATLSFRNMHSQQTPRALVMVDGFVISNFLGADWDTAPKWGVLAPDDIDRVEIAYGPTSARYSGNSLGGTMLLETRAITETAVRLEVQGMAQDYRYYATDERLRGWSADAGVDLKLGDGGGIALGYRHFRNEGQPMEWRMVGAATPYAAQAIIDPQLPFLRVAAQDSVVDATQDQLRLRGRYQFGSWTVHGLAGLLLAADDMPTPKSFLRDARGLPTFVGVAGVTQGAARRAELLSGVGVAGDLGGTRLALNYSRFDTFRNRTRTSDNFDLLSGAAPMGGRIADMDAGWQNLDLTAARTIGAHALSVGLAQAHYRVDSRTFLTADWADGGPGAQRDAAGGETRLRAGFVEDAITLAPALTATLGLRFEHWRASGGFLVNGGTDVRYAARSASAWSPKFALSVAPGKSSRLTASVALATRFPTVRELYQPGLISYGADVGALDLNGFNPDLRPERAVDLQLTATRRFGRVHVTVDAYRQDVRDTIFAQNIAIPDVQSGNLVQSSLLTNIGKVRSIGADLVVAAEDILLPGLTLDANLSWIDAEVTANPLNPALVGNRFPRVPPWRANASLRYAPDPNWDFAINLRHQSTPDRNIENDATSKCSTFFCVSAFSFVDVKVAHRFRGIELAAGIDNLFDEKAFVYHPYPGRSFLITLKWKGRL